ncbi:hypothetical protein Aperf_G00000117750 [Anoplocephala perfoliata]
MEKVCQPLLIIILLASPVLSAHWSYTNPDSSPNKWGEVGNKMCDGVRQSPVALASGQAFYDAKLKPVTIYQDGNFTDAEPFTMTNNGHTLMVSLPSCKYFLQLNGKEDKKFCITQFHFHWGANNSVGSEHSISGEFFPLEMHIVAYDRTSYNTFEEASKGVNGLAVLGLVFHEDKLIPIQNTMLHNMGQFLQKTNDIIVPASSTTLAPFPAKALLSIGNANRRYFRYDGSLTTPPCTENVYWTVISQALPVRSEQLEAMRNLEYPGTETVTKMANNYRKPKTINPDSVVVPRVVFKSWNPASKTYLSSLLLLLLPKTMSLF